MFATLRLLLCAMYTVNSSYGCLVLIEEFPISVVYFLIKVGILPEVMGEVVIASMGQHSLMKTSN